MFMGKRKYFDKCLATVYFDKYRAILATAERSISFFRKKSPMNSWKIKGKILNKCLHKKALRNRMFARKVFWYNHIT